MKSPNIIFVMPDEFRKRALENEPVIRPRLDEFISQSMYMNNAISAIPICSPYRAMMMTGLLPFRNNVYTNCNTGFSHHGVFLRTNQVCWSDIMAENGYDLGYIGKWHLDPPEPKDAEFFVDPTIGKSKIIEDSYTNPKRRHKFNFWHSYGCCNDHLNPHYYHNDAKVTEPFYPKKWSTEHETDVAIDYIKNTNNERDTNKPFALVVAYNPPHMPFDKVPQQYKDLYADKTPEELLTCKNYGATPHPMTPLRAFDNLDYAKRSVNDYFAAITGVDEQFGRILDCLKECDLEDDTIVIFTSDHGELLGSHTLMNKGRFYSESLSMPLIIRYPDKIKANVKNSTVFSAQDWMPTFLGLAGLSDKIPTDLDGENKADIFLKNLDKESQGLIIDQTGNIRGLKTERYTYAVLKDYNNNEEHLLFDDVNDPYQLTDVSKDNKEICTKLRINLENTLQNTNDPWLGI
ncbi:MAG: sulfatase [Clostridia bacterium]